MDLPKDCVRWVKSGTDGLTWNKFPENQAAGLGIRGRGIFRRAQTTRFCHRRSAAENRPAAAKLFSLGRVAQSLGGPSGGGLEVGG